METKFTSFLCDNCHTEIEASPDMIGQTADCPACGSRIVIPPPSDNLVRHGAEDDDPDAAAMKSRTIHIELGDI